MLKELALRTSENKLVIVVILFVACLLVLTVVRPPMAMERDKLSARKTLLWAGVVAALAVVLMYANVFNL